MVRAARGARRRRRRRQSRVRADASRPRASPTPPTRSDRARWPLPGPGPYPGQLVGLSNCFFRSLTPPALKSKHTALRSFPRALMRKTGKFWYQRRPDEAAARCAEARAAGSLAAHWQRARPSASPARFGRRAATRCFSRCAAARPACRLRASRGYRYRWARVRPPAAAQRAADRPRQHSRHRPLRARVHGQLRQPI